jgi:membrane associated rhomboid family serine protease
VSPEADLDAAALGHSSGEQGRRPMLPIQNAVPARYPPVATWGLIAANCSVFLFEISLSPRELELVVSQFALIPAQYSQGAAYGGEPLTLIDYLPFATCMFLHGGWLHPL